MKTIPFLTFFLALTASRDIPAQDRETILTDDPVAWWSLDEANDAIATDHIGSLRGKYVGIASRRGVSGLAANFAGQASGRVQISLDESHDVELENVLNGSFSLELWILDEALAPDGKTNYSLIYKADSKAFTRNSLWLYRARQDGRYYFRIHDSQDRKIQLALPNPAGKSAGDGKWHHLAVVINRDESKPQAIAYLDGKEVDRSTFDPGIAINNDGSLIVGNNFHHSAPWMGAIDELAIYDRPLSQKRVAAHFAAGEQEQMRSTTMADRIGNPAELFELKIRPLLIERCGDCHSGDLDSESVLRIDSRAALLKGGDFGPAIIPGRGADSLLIHAVKGSHKELRMPPENDEALSANEIALLQKWIDRGAVWGESSTVAANEASNEAEDISPRKLETDHWAFQPRKMVAPPDVSDSRWSKSEIDRFVEAKRRKASVNATAAADRYTLIRRATFDLTGLPPTVEEVDDFLHDTDDDMTAFARVIDRLLASQQYGEKQGRQWLDVARYADTQGDVGDYPIPTAYLYRNWVIDSFNADMPFDAFLQAQIAGDILAQAESDLDKARELVIATGFIALSRRFGNRKEDDMHQTIEDTIDTIGRGVLGLTLRCARCHDHKFDPVLNTDYYRLYGIFESTVYPWMGMSDQKSPSDLAPAIPDENSREVADEYWKLITRYEYQINNHFRPWLKPTLAAFKEVDEKLTKNKNDEELLKKQEEILSRHSGKFRELMLHGLDWVKKEKQRLAESPPVEFVFAVSEGKPHDARLHRRGNPKSLGPKVPRGFLQVFSPNPPNNLSGSGRLQLANWLTRSDHPLTARVIVNRVWQQHFGQGIVESADNFGHQGARPTHPQLLDWLADQFVRNGWSIKKLHRQIMLSETYRLASTADGNAQLLTSFQRRRLDAEEIRDAMLMVAGTLDRSQGQEHPFKPWYQARYSLNGPFHADFLTQRRSVYMITQRLFRDPFLGLFDGPDRNSSTASRDQSNVPSQALYLMNSPFVQEQSKALAGRLVGNNERDSIRQLYLLAFAREPFDDEFAAVQQFLSHYRTKSTDEDALVALCRAVLTSNEFFFVD